MFSVEDINVAGVNGALEMKGYVKEAATDTDTRRERRGGEVKGVKPPVGE